MVAREFKLLRRHGNILRGRLRYGLVYLRNLGLNEIRFLIKARHEFVAGGRSAGDIGLRHRHAGVMV